MLPSINSNYRKLKTLYVPFVLMLIDVNQNAVNLLLIK